MKIAKKIEDYQLAELNDDKLFINKYDMDLKYLYELNIHWKEFLFDMLQEMAKIDTVYLEKQSNLLEYLKKDYQKIISIYKLKINIKDYVELEDYISFDEWKRIQGNDIALSAEEIFLIKEM